MPTANADSSTTLSSFIDRLNLGCIFNKHIPHPMDFAECLSIDTQASIVKAVGHFFDKKHLQVVIGGRHRASVNACKADVFPYLLGFRHKKRRPWTSLDIEMVGRGNLNWLSIHLINKAIFG